MPRFDMNQNIPSEGNGSAYLEAGIYDNIVLTDVVADKSKNDNNFLAFYFSDPNGNVVPKTEWEPKGEGEELEKKEENVMTRIKHIAVNSGLFTKEEFNFTADSFEDFIKQVADKFKAKKDKWNSTPVRLKVVYDDNDYTTLPRYTKYTWIESMNIPKEQSKIKILPNIDKLQREQADKEASTNNNPFDNTQEQGEVANGQSDTSAPF